MKNLDAQELRERLEETAPGRSDQLGEVLVSRDGDRWRLAMMAAAPKRKPNADQAGLADLPLFGTKDLF